MIGEFLSGPAAAFRHHHLKECASTNTECLVASERCDPGNLWITADKQTAARGSRGRSWTAEPGNLFASLLLINPGEILHLSELTFVASIALGNAIYDLAGSSDDIDVNLKWPNDVLVGGKKVAGILLESHSNSRSAKVVVGIGVNCNSSPKNTLFPATSLREAGLETEPLQLFDKLADHFADTLTKWDRGNNFSTVRAMWLDKAAGLGKSVEVRLEGKEPISGVFETIDDTGQMQMKLPEGDVRKISVGDVFFRTSTTAGERNG